MKKTKNTITSLRCLLLLIAATLLPHFTEAQVSLWVGESYRYDVTSSVMGLTYNLSWSTNGGYLKLSGSGFYRDVTPTQYFSGTAYVIVEWDYKLTASSKLTHVKREIGITCRDNKVRISPTRLELAPGETGRVSYSHQYSNDYVYAAQAYFSASSSHFSVDQNGYVTAISPGEGYINVYSKISSDSPYCLVVVKDVAVQRASVSDVSIYADATRTLDVSVSPSNATVNSKNWQIVDGSDVISLTSGGTLKGLKPGTAHIKCTVNNSVTSNTATVTVSEPPFKVESIYPDMNSTGANVFTVPSVTYSLTLTDGPGYDGIGLKNMANGEAVDGSPQISGSTVKFISSKPLLPLTAYTMTVPAGAVKNKWGTEYKSVETVTFTTGERDRIELSVSPASGSFISKSENTITIKANASEAEIYYTLDGSTPTVKSQRYTSPIPVDRDVVLKCFATAEGYEDSEVLTAEYFMSRCGVYKAFPKDNDSLYVYGFVNPYILFEGQVKKDDNFRKVTLTDADGNKVDGEPKHYYNAVAFVPAEPLKNAQTYTLTVPAGVVCASNGESNTSYTHTFKTRNMAVKIGIAGNETAMLIAEDGKMSAWGMEYKTMEPSTGAFSYRDQNSRWEVAGNVTAMDGGATHRLYLNSAGELYGSGRQYCGELGQALNQSTVSPVKLASDVKAFSAGCQTTAYISLTGELWMLGRNDFGQLGNGKTTSSSTPVKVMDDVVAVAAGNGFTLAVSSNGELWAWGRNNLGQLGTGTTADSLEPVKVMDNIAKVYASKSSLPFTAAISGDGSLWMWGDNSAHQITNDNVKFHTSPSKVADNVEHVALGADFTLVLSDNSQMYGWGNDADGRIPYYSSDKGSAPLQEFVADIAASGQISLMLMLDGSIYGSGQNSHGILSETKSIIRNPLRIVEGNGRGILEDVIFIHRDIVIEPEDEAVALCKIQPLNADYETVEWSCDNPSIASVSDKGVVTGHAYGHTSIALTITDSWGRSVSAECPVWVQTPEEAAGIISPEAREMLWEARIVNRVLMIDNTCEGAIFKVYNTQGLEIGTIVADDTYCRMPLPNAGVYIVASGSRAVKLLSR